MDALGINDVLALCETPGWSRGLDVDFAAGGRDGWTTVVTAELSPVGWQWMVSQWLAGAGSQVRVCDWGCSDHAGFQALCDRLCQEASAVVGWVCDDAHARRVELPGCRVIDQERWGDSWVLDQGQLTCQLGMWSGLYAVMARLRLGRVRLPADAGHAPAGWLAQLAVEDLGETEDGLMRRRLKPGCTTDFTRNLGRAQVLWRASLRERQR